MISSTRLRLPGEPAAQFPRKPLLALFLARSPEGKGERLASRCNTPQIKLYNARVARVRSGRICDLPTSNPCHSMITGSSSPAPASVRQFLRLSPLATQQTNGRFRNSNSRFHRLPFLLTLRANCIAVCSQYPPTQSQLIPLRRSRITKGLSRPVRYIRPVQGGTLVGGGQGTCSIRFLARVWGAQPHIR